MSIKIETVDLYALLGDLTKHINGHYQVIERENDTRVKFTKATLYDFRWVAENIENNLPYRIKEARPYNECGFELVLIENNPQNIRGN